MKQLFFDPMFGILIVQILQTMQLNLFHPEFQIGFFRSCRLFFLTKASIEVCLHADDWRIRNFFSVFHVGMVIV